MPDLVLQIFRRFHTAFVDAVSNPFYTVNTVRSPLLPAVGLPQTTGHGCHILRRSLHNIVTQQES